MRAHAENKYNSAIAVSGEISYMLRVTKYGNPYSEFVPCIYPIQSAHTHSSEHTHNTIPMLCRILHPCQIMHPFVEIAARLPNPNPTPNLNPSPTLTPKPTNTKGCIIWQGAEFGMIPACMILEGVFGGGGFFI